MENADLVVWLKDLAARDQPDPPTDLEAPILVVFAKADLESAPRPERLSVSAKTGQGLSRLKKEALNLLGLNRHRPPDLVPNFRHQKALEETAAAVELAAKALDEGEPPDIVNLEIGAALSSLGQITGKVMTEDLLAEVFSQFCLGK
jgi:tRNA modification GTPase